MEEFKLLVIVSCGIGILALVLIFAIPDFLRDIGLLESTSIVGILFISIGLTGLLSIAQWGRLDSDIEETKEEVILEEVDVDISNIYIVEEGMYLEEDEVKVEYVVDVDGISYKRDAVVDEDDIERGEEHKIVEEFVKGEEAKERSGRLGELVIKE